MIPMLIPEMDVPLTVRLNLDGDVLKIQLGYLLVLGAQCAPVEMVYSSQLKTSNVMMETKLMPMDATIVASLILPSIVLMFLDKKLNVA